MLSPYSLTISAERTGAVDNGILNISRISGSKKSRHHGSPGLLLPDSEGQYDRYAAWRAELAEKVRNKSIRWSPWPAITIRCWIGRTSKDPIIDRRGGFAPAGTRAGGPNSGFPTAEQPGAISSRSPAAFAVERHIDDPGAVVFVLLFKPLAQARCLAGDSERTGRTRAPPQELHAQVAPAQVSSMASILLVARAGWIWRLARQDRFSTSAAAAGCAGRWLPGLPGQGLQPSDGEQVGRLQAVDPSPPPGGCSWPGGSCRYRRG